ncbi:aminotransferase class I/II-fold pyridoxal phosphate-dependent enzyme [soil metagenome]
MIAGVMTRLKDRTGRGLADAVSAAIRDGALAEGDRLPPIRAVAAELRMSPATVSAAWALLARAGAIRTDGRRGTTVARRAPAGPNRYRRALERQTSFALDLSGGVPDPALLPDLAPALQRLETTNGPSNYLDDPVLDGLIEVLRADWPYRATAFTILDGAMDALDQVAAVLLQFGDRVVVEHPCFPPLLDLLEAAGMRVVGVRLDAEGLEVEGLAEALQSDVRAVFLQPRAQNPTGVSMSSRRARQLGDLLAGRDVLVVEDDSAGAVAFSPAVSLGSMLPEQTVHIRSFSKSHGPDLRLAAVSGSAEHIEALTQRRFLGQGWTSRLLQSLLLDLLTHARSRTTVEHARLAYAQRRNDVVGVLQARGITVAGQDGLNIWLPVVDEAAALVRLASRGIGAAAGKPFAVLTGDGPHLRVTTALITEDTGRIADELAEAATLGAWTSPR